MKGFLGGAAAVLLLLNTGCQQQEEQGAGRQEPLKVVDEEEGEEGTGFPFSLLPETDQEPDEEMNREPDADREAEPRPKAEMEGNDKQQESGGGQQTQNRSVKAEVIALTNEEREKQGLNSLKEDETVAKAAQAKSEDMAENNYFAHQSPTYGSPFNMLKEYGADFRSAAENIAAGQATPEQAVEGWMNSEGHRKNILNEDLTHIGIGYEENGRYWTQMFIEK
ncbi:CAP domain-containing protein [Salibacterium sp. K-3]